MPGALQSEKEFVLEFKGILGERGFFVNGVRNEFGMQLKIVVVKYDNLASVYSAVRPVKEGAKLAQISTFFAEH